MGSAVAGMVSLTASWSVAWARPEALLQAHRFLPLTVEDPPWGMGGEGVGLVAAMVALQDILLAAALPLLSSETPEP